MHSIVNGDKAAANTCHCASTNAGVATGTPPANPTGGGVLLDVFIPGHPATQGSKRHVGGGRMVEMDKKLPAWRQAIKLVCGVKYRGEPIDQPVTVDAMFYLPRPKRPKFDVPAVTPDVDKLARALGDGLTGVVIKDDSRITRWEIEKRYAENGQIGAHVVVAAA